MEQSLLNFFTKVSDFIWGYPLMFLLVGTGLFLTIILRGVQFRKLGYSLMYHRKWLRFLRFRLHPG